MNEIIKFWANLQLNSGITFQEAVPLRFLVMRELKVPIISAINGPAVGAGFCLALGNIFKCHLISDLRSNGCLASLL